MTKLAVAIGATLLLSSAVHAQTRPADPESRIAAALQRAAAVGIPTSLLLLKVQEGRAKGIPGERIATAVERREGSLTAARRQLAGIARVGNQDLAVAADALEAGISATALRQVASSAPVERRVIAVVVLMQLAQIGTPVDAAVAQALDEVSALATPTGRSRAHAPRRPAPGERGPPDHAGPAAPAGITTGPPASLPQPRGRGNPRSRRNRP